jgi:hypothetical protein
VPVDILRDKLVERQTNMPVYEPVDKPTEKPVDKPVDKPRRNQLKSQLTSQRMSQLLTFQPTFQPTCHPMCWFASQGSLIDKSMSAANSSCWCGAVKKVGGGASK